MLNTKLWFLCLFIPNIQCCAQTTFEGTRLIALKNINLKDEISDYNYFIKAPTNNVIPIMRITGCITSTEEFQDVVAVQIRGERVPIMHEGAVQNLPFLHSLHIESSNVAIIKPRAFQNLPSLTVLKIEDNNLEMIQSQVFNDLLVRKLILMYNRITYIVFNAFDNMPLLESIRLDHNRLSAWMPEWFQNCPRLSLISAKFNRFASLPENAFQNVKDNMERLYVGYNNIKEINPEVFKGFKSLTDVGLSHNNITKIDNYIFLHLEKLKVIDLSETDITCFSKEFLNTLQNDVLLWINNIPLNETCKEVLDQWVFDKHGNMRFYLTLRNDSKEG